MNIQPVTCKNCGNSFSGQYCNACGQQVFETFNLLYLWRLFHRDFLEVDRGLWRTLKDLTIKPGYMIHNFLGGQTKKYFSPLKYLLVWITLLYVLLSIFSPELLEFSETWENKYFFNANPPFSNDTIGDFYNVFPFMIFESFSLYFLLMIPFISLGVLIVFRKYNFTEYMIIWVYLWGHSIALSLSILFIAPLIVLLDSDIIVLVASSFYMILLLIFWVRTFKQLHDLSWGKTILKFILGLYGGMIPFYAFATIAFMVLKYLLA